MERHIGVTTIWTTFCRCLKKMLGLQPMNRTLEIPPVFRCCWRRTRSFAGLSSRFRTSFSKALPIKNNARFRRLMPSAADIVLRAAYHAHGEKPSPIFSTPAAAFCYGSLPQDARQRGSTGLDQVSPPPSMAFFASSTAFSAVSASAEVVVSSSTEGGKATRIFLPSDLRMVARQLSVSRWKASIT
jgi:hypothetical protein